MINADNVGSVSDSKEVMTYKKWVIYNICEGVFYLKDNAYVNNQSRFFGLDEGSDTLTESQIFKACLTYIEVVTAERPA